MSEPLLTRTNELQAMSRQDLKVAVGLLTGHKTFRAHMLKLGFTQRQDCRPCGDERRYVVVYILYLTARHWHAKDTEPRVVCS